MAGLEVAQGAKSDRPVHEKAMKSGLLISLALHGRGGLIPPLIDRKLARGEKMSSSAMSQA